jgi:hypothetical protein
LEERKAMARADLEARLVQRAEDVIQREQVEVLLAEFEGVYGLERRMVGQQMQLVKEVTGDYGS